ncbi:hypothetical protein L596_015326 [Steinernema carpocapsae]|uniref:Uncharacterized protein n=1 Tax=Steinernema carpocapsae TaxID=34508 RepID=A0A4U5NFI8_STECR|nr:hypothetical protein L596_015326 [Steinernema carpocapsae]
MDFTPLQFIDELLHLFERPTTLSLCTLSDESWSALAEEHKKRRKDHIVYTDIISEVSRLTTEVDSLKIKRFRKKNKLNYRYERITNVSFYARIESSDVEKRGKEMYYAKLKELEEFLKPFPPFKKLNVLLFVYDVFDEFLQKLEFLWKAPVEVLKTQQLHLRASWHIAVWQIAHNPQLKRLDLCVVEDYEWLILIVKAWKTNPRDLTVLGFRQLFNEKNEVLETLKFSKTGFVSDKCRGDFDNYELRFEDARLNVWVRNWNALKD